MTLTQCVDLHVHCVTIEGSQSFGIGAMKVEMVEIRGGLKSGE
jgi:hypothetical protein